MRGLCSMPAAAAVNHPTRGREAAVALVVLLGVLLSGCVAAVRTAERSLGRQVVRDGLEHRVETIAGANLEYWVDTADASASRPPVVLLHGFGPPGPWQWVKQVDALHDEYRILMPNLPWFGASTDPGRDFGVGRQAEVVAALMEREEMGGATVIGTSYGGLVAYALALDRPDLVARLVIMDSPGGVYAQSDLDGLLARHHVASAVELFVPSDAAGVKRLLGLAYQEPPPVSRGLGRATVQVIYDRHRVQKAELLRALVRDMDTYAARPPPRLPALVVWGIDDPVFPLAIGRRLSTALEAELVVVPNSHHAPQVEHPREVNDVLLRWLAAPRKPPRA